MRSHFCAGIVIGVLAAILASTGLGPTSVATDAGNEFASVSVKDLKAMRTALLAYLDNSDLGDREELLRLTRNSEVAIDGPDSKRIGLWQLAPGLSLVIRLGESKDLIVRYRATVYRDGKGWRIGEVESQFFHGARH